MTSSSTQPLAAKWHVSNASDRLDTLQHDLAAASPVRAHVFVMSLLFGMALFVAYILLPGDSERIAMLERDGKTTEARSILEARFVAGDRRQRTLFQLQSLYEQAGELPKARQTLELLAQQRPRDTALQRQLGLFYKQTQDEPAYIRSLLAQIDLRYSESACREVTGLLRRKGAFNEEQAALSKCRQKGYRRPDDMMRLASLLSADGDIKEASVLLRAVDDLRRLKTDRERLQLFQLLIENDQPGEAQRRAVRWVKGNKDDAFALTLISSLVADNRQDLAIELARDTSVPGDSVFLAIGEIMVDRDQTAAAEAILRGWLEKAVLIEPAVAARFITAALGANAPDLALAAAQKIGLSKLSAPSTAELARGLDAAGRRADGDALRATLREQAGALLPAANEESRQPLRSPKLAGSKIANLDGWRSGLWKRLRDENKPAIASPLPNKLAVSSKRLEALKRARKANTYRRLGPGKQKSGQSSPPFGFFDAKP
jgi:thioredoxin-like negative regulator of GroEL